MCITTASVTIETCTDTDGDGIPDVTDLDDDNDGILDDDECPGINSGNTTNLVNNGSFENYSGSDGLEISDNVNNTTLVGWTAVSNDGEVWFSNQNFAAYEGNNYVELLQNSNANTNTYWNETYISNSTAGYDRIVTEIATQPNTSYTVKFFSKVGGRLISSYTGPVNTLLQVQSKQTNMAFSDQFVEQSNWTEKTINSRLMQQPQLFTWYFLQ